eukprot:g5677.t1
MAQREPGEDNDEKKDGDGERQGNEAKTKSNGQSYKKEEKKGGDNKGEEEEQEEREEEQEEEEKPLSVTIGHAFTFKHAILRETAYGGVLFAQRRRLHLTIATWLQQQIAPFVKGVHGAIIHGAAFFQRQRSFMASTDAAAQYALIAHHLAAASGYDGESFAAQAASGIDIKRDYGLLVRSVDCQVKAANIAGGLHANEQVIAYLGGAIRTQADNMLGGANHHAAEILNFDDGGETRTGSGFLGAVSGGTASNMWRHGGSRAGSPPGSGFFTSCNEEDDDGILEDGSFDDSKESHPSQDQQQPFNADISGNGGPGVHIDSEQFAQAWAVRVSSWHRRVGQAYANIGRLHVARGHFVQALELCAQAHFGSEGSGGAGKGGVGGVSNSAKSSATDSSAGGTGSSAAPSTAVPLGDVMKGKGGTKGAAGSLASGNATSSATTNHKVGAAWSDASPKSGDSTGANQTTSGGGFGSGALAQELLQRASHARQYVASRFFGTGPERQIERLLAAALPLVSSGKNAVPMQVQSHHDDVSMSMSMPGVGGGGGSGGGSGGGGGGSGGGLGFFGSRPVTAALRPLGALMESVSAHVALARLELRLTNHFGNEGLTVAVRGAALAAKAGLPSAGLARAWALLTIYTGIVLGAHTLARKCGDLAVGAAEIVGDPTSLCYVCYAVACVATSSGQWERGRDAAKRGQDLATSLRDKRMEEACMQCIADIARYTSDLSVSQRLYEDLLGRTHDRANFEGAVSAELARYRVLLRRGAVEEATAGLRTLERVIRERMDEVDPLTRLSVCAEILYVRLR